MNTDLPVQLIDPTRIFEYKGQSCRLLSATLAPSANTSTAIVAAITGSVVSLMGWKIQSQAGTAAFFRFRNGSAGSLLNQYFACPPITNGLTDFIPVTTSILGMETSVSTALYLEADATNAISALIWYITYKP